MIVARTHRCCKCKPGIKYPEDIKIKFCDNCSRYHRDSYSVLQSSVREVLLSEIRRTKYSFVTGGDIKLSFYRYYELEYFIVESLSSFVLDGTVFEAIVSAMFKSYVLGSDRYV